MPKHLLAPVGAAALALAFGLGFWTGRAETARSPRPGEALSPATASRSVRGTEAVALEGVAGEIREILLNPDVLERTGELARRLSQLGPESLEAVRSAYDTVFLDRGDVDLALLVDWWVGFDPEGAFEFTSREWRADHPAIVVSLLRAWARRDPRDALAAAQRSGLNRAGAPYLHAVLAGWDASGEPGLFEYVASLPGGADRQRAISVLARRRVLRDGPEEAFRWAEALPDSQDAFKLNVFRRVAGAAAEVDPQGAAAFAERHYADPALGKGLPLRVGMAWAKRDPEAAMLWLATLPAGPNRDDAVGETYRTWLRGDRTAAREWLRNTEPEPWLDPAVSLYAQSIAYESSERAAEALEQVARISDEQTRNAAIVLVARLWLERDRPAAEAWLASADLPDAVRERASQLPPYRQRLLEGREAARGKTGGDETSPE
jgi:hypothetical protein